MHTSSYEQDLAIDIGDHERTEICNTHTLVFQGELALHPHWQVTTNSSHQKGGCGLGKRLDARRSKDLGY